MESKIFVRSRVLGYVSNSVPLKTRYIKKRKENVIVTCVGKYFYTWCSSKFSLLTVSPKHDSEIHCIEGDNFLIFTASGIIVQAWRRGAELQQTYKSSSCSPVHLLLPFGPHLIGVDEDNIMTVWDIKTEDVYLEMNFSAETFLITSICHPYSYVNKMLLGSKQGSMQLRNISSSKLVYSFSGWGSQINILEQSPALDVIGIGLHDGKIILHNIKLDETVMTFFQDWGPVTKLSFCTDNAPIMVSGTNVGHIVFWNLEERKVVSQLLSAHEAAVTGLQYLPSEQLIVSSSPDNSLKMWMFDMSKGSAHLLRLREGHKTCPSFVRFHGPLGNYVLSAGSDGYLRAFNTEVEIANKNLGRALYRCNKRNLKKKLSEEEDELKYSPKVLPIAQFTSETTREKEWDNIAAIHNDTALISTWSFDKCKFGSFLSRPNKQQTNGSFQKMRTTSIFLTHCGNFVIVGYSSGQVDKFNIQSGIYRGSYGKPKAHNGFVTGIFVNNVNCIMITGATDHLIRFWSFRYQDRERLSEVNVGDPVLFFRSQEESSLLAVAIENFTIVMIDTDCRTIVRRFSGHSGEITDATFSPDCRWLVSASMDSTLQTWDIPSGKCIDVIQLESPCVSVTFSPTNTCIATAHVDCLGVTLWANRCLFSLVSLIQVEPFSDTIKTTDTDVSTENSLIRFSADDNLIISSRWQNILSLDTIRKRNRLKEPPKVQEEAPFILPTVPSVHIKFDLSNVETEKDHHSDRIIKPNKIENSTVFGKALLKAADTSDFEAVSEKLKTLSLTAVAFEIGSLSPDSGGSIEHVLQFLKMLEVMFTSKQCFEISSAFLAQFLKTHASLLIKEPELIPILEKLSQLHDECWSTLENKLLYSKSICKFIMDS